MSRINRWSDPVAHAVTLTFLVTSVGVLAVTAGYVVREASPALTNTGDASRLLWTDGWRPMSDPPRYGLRHAWLSTLWVTGIALVIALPIGFGVGVFLSEMAPPLLRQVVPPFLELLAGVPSVVYGFVGHVTLVAWSERAFGMPTGESLLIAGIVLAVMVLPFIGSTSAEAFRAAPAELREAAYAQGVTRWHVVRRVLVPHVRPALFGGAALAFARAAGETLAVLMLAGNSTEAPRSALDRGQPLTALIATELGEAGVGSPKSHALMGAGLVLLLLVVLLNSAVWSLKRRMVHRVA